jgi:hypothetical protein
LSLDCTHALRNFTKLIPERHQALEANVKLFHQPNGLVSAENQATPGVSFFQLCGTTTYGNAIVGVVLA